MQNFSITKRNWIHPLFTAAQCSWDLTVFLRKMNQNHKNAELKGNLEVSYSLPFQLVSSGVCTRLQVPRLPVTRVPFSQLLTFVCLHCFVLNSCVHSSSFGFTSHYWIAWLFIWMELVWMCLSLHMVMSKTVKTLTSLVKHSLVLIWFIYIESGWESWLSLH